VVNIVPESPAHHFYSTNAYLVPVGGFTLPSNTFVDPDNQALTYAVSKPGWLSYSWDPAVGHRFYGVNANTQPYNEFTITLTATDTLGVSKALGSKTGTPKDRDTHHLPHTPEKLARRAPHARLTHPPITSHSIWADHRPGGCLPFGRHGIRDASDDPHDPSCQP
jgi:hypothetical protein